MIQIRSSVFETNSSSTHSITICTENEFERWQKGEMFFNRDDDTLVEKSKLPQEILDLLNDEDAEDDIVEQMEELDKGIFLTYEQWSEYEQLENYVEEYTSPSGDKIVAFGFYGNQW
jgi:hypothetical protein